MAGIGFKLKKAFQNRSLYTKTKSLAHAGSVTAGPWLWAITTMLIIFAVSDERFSAYSRNLSAYTILYSFAISHILLSTTHLVVTRYISDMIYMKKLDNIMPSFFSLNTIIIPLSLIASTIYYLPKDLPNTYKIMGIILLTLITMIMCIMTYLSSSKDYRSIGRSFMSGGIIALGLYVSLYGQIQGSQYFSFEKLVIGSILLGLSASYILLLRVLLNTYPDGLKFSYEFLSYYKKVPSFVFIALFYTVGIWSDNLIMGFDYRASTLAHAFGYVPSYDLAAIIGLVTLIPTGILYTVFIETEFFVSYRKFMHRINNNGTLAQINEAHVSMKQTLYKWLIKGFGIQFAITIVVIVFVVYGSTVSPLTLVSIPTIIYLMIGSLFVAYSYINLNIMLYFDMRIQSLLLSGIFLCLNIVLTLIFALCGSCYSGIGFMIACLITFVLSSIMVVSLMQNTVYIIFSKHNVFR